MWNNTHGRYGRTVLSAFFSVVNRYDGIGMQPDRQDTLSTHHVPGDNPHDAAATREDPMRPSSYITCDSMQPPSPIPYASI